MHLEVLIEKGDQGISKPRGRRNTSCDEAVVCGRKTRAIEAWSNVSEEVACCLLQSPIMSGGGRCIEPVQLGPEDLDSAKAVVLFP